MPQIDETRKIKETLEDHEKRIKSLEDRFLIAERKEVAPSADGIGFKKLAEKLGVDVKKLEGVFDIDANSLTLLKVSGEDVTEKTKNISLVVLLGYKYYFGNEKLLSKEIRRNVAENRIPVNNFATYLNGMIPSLIRRIGKRKSPKTTYKLTPLGEAEAKEITKEFCK
jgi:hypothetical protein